MCRPALLQETAENYFVLKVEVWKKKKMSLTGMCSLNVQACFPARQLSVKGRFERQDS